MPWQPDPPSGNEEQAVARHMRAEYGVIAWYGHATGRWWPMQAGQLVDARTPDDLRNTLSGGRLH
ncbi:hypothetical protein ACFY4C_41530 [Actinomadura viridis]|uniref:hypothetical protein n=1 Tax=Actinomadura viridis TaxID=58110 RepID=UPI0036A528D0